MFRERDNCVTVESLIPRGETDGESGKYSLRTVFRNGGVLGTRRLGEVIRTVPTEEDDGTDYVTRNGELFPALAIAKGFKEE